jgi:hypothetical protein
MRAVLLVLFAWSLTAHADAKKVSRAQAVKANQQAFDRALAKRKLQRTTLTGSRVTGAPATAEGTVVVTLSSHGPSDEPVFVVDANKQVFRVIRAPRKLGRVRVTVCHAGPVARYAMQFAVPPGHTYKGELKLTYDASEIWEQNSCR